MNNEIHIAFCLDDNYFEPTYLLICSILKTNKNEFITFHIIFDTLSHNNIVKFSDLRNDKVNFIFRKINNFDFENCPIREGDRVSLATYYRLLMPIFIPENIHKILYLDGDMLCFDSLRDLYETELTNCSLAACLDSQCQNMQRKTLIGLKEETDYFAAGMLLINLDYWRENHTHIKLMQYVAENSEKLLWHDQDALNAVLEGTVKKLDFKYNFYETYFKTKQKTSMTNELWEETQTAKSNICILHYMQTEKPWYYECEHPLKNIWRSYYKKTFGHRYKLKFKYNGKMRLSFIKSIVLKKIFKPLYKSSYNSLPIGLYKRLYGILC